MGCCPSLGRGGCLTRNNREVDHLQETPPPCEPPHPSAPRKSYLFTVHVAGLWLAGASEPQDSRTSFQVQLYLCLSHRPNFTGAANKKSTRLTESLFTKSYLFSVHVSPLYNIHIISILLGHNPYEFSVLEAVPPGWNPKFPYNLGTAASHRHRRARFSSFVYT